MQKKYKDQVQFLCVYVREAHPTDGWRMQSNDLDGITFEQPSKLEDRVEIADQCCKALNMSMPLVVDGMDDAVGHAYSGMPDRLYIVDTDGRVAYKGGRGPFGFMPREMEQSLLMLLLERAMESGKSLASTKKVATRLPALDQNEAWRRLPAVKQGTGLLLPAWARVLAKSLPETTATMLELDYLHRAESPLPPLLRGKMRWVAAKANGCAYTRLQAEADLLRAGLEEDQLAALRKGAIGKLGAEEKAALTFARKLTQAAHEVTDDEVADLRKCFGDKQVVAMVQLLAHANFQDRLLLTLGITPEVEPPLPPLAVQFDFSPAGTAHILRSARKSPVGHLPAAGLQGAELKRWTSQTLDELKAQMTAQKEKKGRIPVPTWDELVLQFPALAKRKNSIDIKWSRVCMGYQPKLASGWGRCMQSFGREAKQDRVFEESLFWVVTRTLQCFY